MAPLRDRLLRRSGQPEIAREVIEWEDWKFLFAAPYSGLFRARQVGIENRICRLARAHGVEVVIAPQPEVFQRAGTIPDAELERRKEAETDGYAELSRTQYPLFIEPAREVAAAQEVIFADFGGVFDATDDEIFVDRVHLNDRGNELIAGRLLPAVARALGYPAPVVGRATGNSEDSGIK